MNKKIFMQKLLGLVSIASISISVIFSPVALAASPEAYNYITQVTINEKDVVRDSNFKAAINTALKRPPSQTVLAGDMRKLKTLDASYRNIRDTTGLEYATELKTLIINRNKISQINLSSNINLETLDISGNLIKELDLSENVNLKELEVSNNSIENLDLSSNIRLINLSSNNNGSKNILFDTNLELKTAKLAGNNLENSGLYSIIKLPSLTYLDLHNSNLTSINLSQNAELTQLILSNNKIQSVDLSKNNKLETIEINNNQISELDLSNNNKLVCVYAHQNKISNVSMPESGIEVFDVSDQEIFYSGIPSVGGKVVYENKLKFNNTPVAPCNISDGGNYNNETNEIIWDNVTAGNVSFEFNQATSTYDSYSGTAFLNLEAQEPQHIIIDEELRKVINLELKRDDLLGYISIDDLETLTELNDASGKGIEFLNGLEYAYGLTTLDLSDNNISNASPVSSLLNLETLNLSNNNIEVLDVSQNTELIELKVYNNSISQLNLLQNINLVNIDVSYNYNLGQNLALPTTNTINILDVSDIKLSNLDISPYTNLKVLTAMQNSLTTIDLSQNSNLVEVDLSSNKLNSIQLSNNTNIKNLFLNDNKLEELTGIENLTNLIRLSASKNLIKSIDLSKNLNLFDVILSNNKINQIDLSKNTLLDYVNLTNQTINQQVTVLDSTVIYDNSIIYNAQKIDELTSISNGGTYDKETGLVIWKDIEQNKLEPLSYGFDKKIKLSNNSGSKANQSFTGKVIIELVYPTN